MALPDRPRLYRGQRVRLFLWVALVELVPMSVVVFHGEFRLGLGQWVLLAVVLAVVAVLVWVVLRTDLVVGPSGVTRCFWGVRRHWRWSRIDELKEYASFDPGGRRHVYYDVHGGGKLLFRFTSSMEGAEEAAETIQEVIDMQDPRHREAE